MNRLKRATTVVTILWVGLPMLFATGNASAQLGPHQKAIGEVYREWVAATNAKDLEHWASFLAPSAIFLPPNSPALSTEKAIKDFYAQSFTDSRFSLDCRQERVEVAKSEDLAWSTGHCEATFTAPDGKEGHGKSKWAKVWKRLSNGEWKCTLNSWSSTLAK
jgi:uncharacterized protein (TIGR02246 family)